MRRSVRHLTALKALGSGVMRLGGQQRLIVDAALLGVAGAAAAQVFTYLLRGASWLFQERLAGYRAPGLPDEGGCCAKSSDRTVCGWYPSSWRWAA
jgi:hypothetical protein